MDSTNPHTQPSNFVDLLNRQQDTPFPYASFPLDGDIGSSQLPLFTATRKIDGTGKKRKCDDGAQSESSQAPADLGEESPRPPGVKAAKGAAGKRSIADQEAGKGAAHFQTMWSIKEKDLAIKKELKKMGLLDSLISKKEPLSEFEDALKTKLLTEMLNL
ncbi:hypothetical protein Bca52824_054173 [Brassica carinata]|uniref:No apical meristem-associated C-terminal domain-containing protein n=1 Tax=Brassica carinata TaxID=52824 RepID=A0A8X7R5B8_BRACI|nr:hypothetical protein Bca52824_054173 [Brassica carinata]